MNGSEKLFWRVSVTDVDTDGDGLTNHEEHLARTDPTLADTDGDTLSDLAELLAGSDPGNADADGDGLIDPVELAGGTDPNNQDSDFDGIPDPIDSQPLFSAFLFADADGDGIEDGSDDTDPGNPRGPAPSLASQTAAGGTVPSFVAGETLRMVITVSNPAGPSPTPGDLTLFLNGVEKTAQITTLSDPAPSTRRFLLAWTAEVTDVYPSRNIQNLTLRFRDAQQATSWIKLANVDVAEWEGTLAICPLRFSAADEQGMKLRIISHLGGKQRQNTFGGAHNATTFFYRGPREIAVLDDVSGQAVTTFPIPKAMKSPIFLTRNLPSGITISSTIEGGDYTAFPHNSARFQNNSASRVEYDWGGVVTNVPVGSNVIQDYGTA